MSSRDKGTTKYFEFIESYKVQDLQQVLTTSEQHLSQPFDPPSEADEAESRIRLPDPPGREPAIPHECCGWGGTSREIDSKVSSQDDEVTLRTIREEMKNEGEKLGVFIDSCKEEMMQDISNVSCVFNPREEQTHPNDPREMDVHSENEQGTRAGQHDVRVGQAGCHIQGGHLKDQSGVGGRVQPPKVGELGNTARVGAGGSPRAAYRVREGQGVPQAVEGRGRQVEEETALPLSISKQLEMAQRKLESVVLKTQEEVRVFKSEQCKEKESINQRIDAVESTQTELSSNTNDILANLQDFKTEQRKEKDFVSKRFGRVESAQTDANETSADLQQFKLRQLEKSKSINDRFDAVELTQGKLSSCTEKTFDDFQEFKAEQHKMNKSISTRIGTIKSSQDKLLSDANETSADLQSFVLQQRENNKSIFLRAASLETSRDKLASELEAHTNNINSVQTSQWKTNEDISCRIRSVEFAQGSLARCMEEQEINHQVFRTNQNSLARKVTENSFDIQHLKSGQGMINELTNDVKLIKSGVNYIEQQQGVIKAGMTNIENQHTAAISNITRDTSTFKTLAISSSVRSEVSTVTTRSSTLTTDSIRRDLNAASKILGERPACSKVKSKVLARQHVPIRKGCNKYIPNKTMDLVLRSKYDKLHVPYSKRLEYSAWKSVGLPMKKTQPKRKFVLPRNAKR